MEVLIRVGYPYAVEKTSEEGKCRQWRLRDRVELLPPDGQFGLEKTAAPLLNIYYLIL